jgi:hypothetical protein
MGFSAGPKSFANFSKLKTVHIHGNSLSFWRHYMKKLVLLIFAATLVIGLVLANVFTFGRIGSGFAKFSMDFGGVHGSGNVITEKLDLSGFNGVEVGRGFQVEIAAGKEFSVEVAGDDNLLPLVTTEIHDGILNIDTEKRISPTTPVRVRISAPDISRLNTSGGATVNATGLRNSGLSIDSSGGSKVVLSGETAKFEVEISGGAKVLAEGLSVVDARIDGSGGSYVEVRASGELSSDVSGGSHVAYYGTPASILTNKSGGARVTQKK